MRDTGIGIAAGKYGQLFDKFSQLDASINRRYGGTGLGLAISKQLAELMGGQSGVTSEEGKGSEFWFTARLCKQTPVEHPQAPANPATHELQKLLAGRKMRVLVAEDNITNQQVTLGILKRLGLRADAVANGAEVLKALATLPYDLVFMDLQMPVMDGIEATRQIRQRQAPSLNPDLPIIAVTAYAMTGDRERCLTAGMNDYVAKPVSPQALADVLCQWLPLDAEAASQPTSASPPVLAVGSAREPAPRVFDQPGFMARMLGDETLAHEILICFLQNLPRQLDTLSDALHAGDASAIASTAHSLKGAAANISAEALRTVADTLEQAARAEDLPSAKAHLAALETQCVRLREIISRVIENRREGG